MSLEIRNLVLTRLDGVRLLGPLDLDLAPGERLGLVGESGSGKTLLARALFGVLPPGVRQGDGTIRAFGAAPARDGRMAWVHQDPGQALHPLLTVAQHLALLPRVQRRERPAAALARLAPLLERLALPGGPAFLRRRPHQLSGGQRQRLCLAMALSCDPALLVLDEPTTALDPLAQRAFLELVLDLQRARGLGVLWITHDLGLAAEACERLVVLYGGQSLEAGPAARLLSAPRHPYTARLLAAARQEPSTEAGFLAAPEERPAGCPFQPRCPASTARCGVPRPWRGAPDQGFRCERPLPSPH